MTSQEVTFEMKKMGWLGCALILGSVAACDVGDATESEAPPAADEGAGETVSDAKQALIEMGFDCHDGWGYDYGPLMDEMTFAYAEDDCFDDPWGGDWGGDPWGGGGGFGDPNGDGPCEWWPEATYFGVGSSSDASESVARQQASSQAGSQASSQCLASGRFCTAYVSWTRLDEMDCFRSDDPDTGYIYTCSAKRSAGCLYR